MGLAASQARFLGLTARKSNVEYQGQQINQARTALSNEVMGLYQKYNDLKVPVAPSVNEFQKTVYTLDSTYEDYTITNYAKISSGAYAGYYNVTLTYDQEIPKVYPYTAKDAVLNAKKNGDDYTYLGINIGTTSYYYDENDPEGSTITKITGDYDKYQGLPEIMKQMGVTDGTFFMYIKNGTAYYTSQTDLDATAWTSQAGEMTYYGDYTFEYLGSQKKETNVQAIAALTQESNGRLSSIQVFECPDAPDLIGNTYSITTTQVEDKEGYEDAMNQYNYQKSLYENEVQKINKETEKLQTEDKSLELKLQQLDTEQNAIATEMESVSKVIEDTIESVFKTFQ